MNIQRLNAILQMEQPLQEPKPPEAPKGGPSFGEVLGMALTQMEQDQNAANEATVKLSTGEIKDVAEVMIASERANLSLGLALQVRNKLLEAYQDIMRMQI